MADLDRALETQLANIEKRTGKSLDELGGIIRESGLTRHGELVAMLKSSLGMGHGDANTLVHAVRRARESEGGAAAPADPLETLYTGPKTELRPIHQRLHEEMQRFGPFDEAPKQTYVSYRRKKQFATIGPATKTAVELGLNARGLPAGGRLRELPPGKMCNYMIRLSSVADVDEELIGWLREAYDSSG